EMEALGEASLFEEAMRNPDLWHPRRGFAAVASGMVEHARLSYPRLEGLYVPGEAVAVGGSIALGVRLAPETPGMPAATRHPRPGILHSNQETPAYPGFAAPRWWPTWFKRAFFDLVFAIALDPHIAPGLNAFRAELGLPPVRDVIRSWIHSPQ